MSLLSNLKTSTTVQDEKDVLGGTFTVLDSDIYTGTIKYAYLQQAQSSSAMSLNLCVEIDGKEYKETLWMTNKNGDNFYVAKDGNQNYLPGFTVANNIALFTCQKPLSELNTEDKILKLYNYEQKQEVPTQVPCITDMHGKDIALAIMKEVRPKQQKNDAGVYVDTTETREANSIQKVFHPTKHLTVAEIKAQADKPEFYDRWLEKNKGQVRTVAPKGAAATATKAGTQNSSVSSLFAN